MRQRGSALGALLAALLMTAAPSFGEDQPSEVTFLAPLEGSNVAQGSVYVIGRLRQERGLLYLSLNGAKVENLVREGPGFSAAVTPVPGKNVLEVKGSAVLGSLTFTYGPTSLKRPSYTFHEPLVENECRECHVKEQKKPRERQELCFECHTKWKNSLVHGPVGAGECLFCHDPHGSSFASLMRQGVKQTCISCHDQPSSREHISRSQNQDCDGCHDPHGGNKKFFLKK